MSTLSISRPSIPMPRTSPAPDVDARFDALVRTAAPAPRTGTDFETVFDLDYGQPADAAAPVVRAVRVTKRVRPAAVQPRPVPRTVRLTRRGRLVALLAFVGIALALMTVFGGWATASLTGGTPEPVRVIEVAPGDTLYDIAADLAQPGQIRTMVHRIQELNSLPGGQITEGQKLAVPRG
ncbi:MAG: Peptidoglycan-binding LysM [Marmoricola sp.]|jgi:hypothetical protein|nr:Peptidoglycan-binding LysM [Marmoricola sp.]